MANRITLLLFGLGFMSPQLYANLLKTILPNHRNPRLAINTYNSALKVANIVTYSYPFTLVEVLGNMLICYIYE